MNEQILLAALPPLPWPHQTLRRSDRPQQRVRVFDSTESHDPNLQEKPFRLHEFRQNEAPEFARVLLKNQVQKYEKGTNRIGAGRLQQIASIQQVPISFFFEGAPGSSSSVLEEVPSSAYVSDFYATSDGLALTKAYLRIRNAKLRRSIVDLVKQIAGDDKH